MAWIASKGAVGHCPAAYITIRAARFLGVAPWELENRPDGWFWKDKALLYEEAEAEAERQHVRYRNALQEFKEQVGL